jgi:RND family efflux transporter MFP subunit
MGLMGRATLIAVAILALGSQAAPQEEVLRPVKLMTLEAERNVLEREFFGQVVARQTVDLAFQVSGRILELPVIEGQRLEAGEVVAQLDLEPFRLRLEQARLEQEQASRTLERQKTLAGTVPQATIEDAETAAELAAIAVRDAEFELEQATLHAPFDALAADRRVAKFSAVSAGTPVARIHDMSEIRIEIEVPEILFRRAQSGSQLQLFAEFPGSDEVHPLEIREFQAETSSIGQTYTVTLGMEPLDDPSIIPGASATVIARQPTEDRVVLVPPTAVVIAPDRSTHVMVFQAEDQDVGTVQMEPVSLEARTDGSLHLIEGPEPGTEIVTTGAMSLTEGQRVRRFKGFGE